MNLRYETLIEALEVAADSDQSYVFLEHLEPTYLSYTQLFADAKMYAAKLQAYGILPGDRVIVVLPTSVQFTQIWWAIQLVGGVSCVLPAAMLQKEGVKKLYAINEKVDAKLLITPDLWGMLVEGINILSPSRLEDLASDSFMPIRRLPDDMAMIQATSGSTSAPKCVALTHRNLLSNAHQIGVSIEARPTDVLISWLPLYHDMGLIGCVITSLYWQVKSYYLPQNHFLRRPHLWLKAMSKFGGTISPAPNFAFALAMMRTKYDLIASLDLSKWRIALCGAEPIDSRVLLAFAQRFSKSGFSATALTPCYGMAEASLCVTMTSSTNPMRVETVDRQQLWDEKRAVVVNHSQALNVVDCGLPVPGSQVCIQDDDGIAVEDGAVGHIWLAGPSIMDRYFNDPLKSAEQEGLRQKVKGHVAKKTGVPPTQVHLVPRRTIPRTTSGKVQRNKLKSQFEATLTQPLP